MVLLIRTDSLRGLLTVAEQVEAIEEGYRQWAVGNAVNHPRQNVQVDATRLSMHAGALPTQGVIGVRVHCNYLDQAGGGAAAASHDSLQILYDPAGGGLKAIFIGRGLPRGSGLGGQPAAALPSEMSPRRPGDPGPCCSATLPLSPSPARNSMDLRGGEGKVRDQE